MNPGASLAAAWIRELPWTAAASARISNQAT
jgi:hypothetical protein